MALLANSDGPMSRSSVKALATLAVGLIDEAFDMFESKLRKYPHRGKIARRRFARHPFKRQSFESVAENFARRLAAQSVPPMRTREHKSQCSCLGVGCAEGQGYCPDRFRNSYLIYGPLDRRTVSEPLTRTGEPSLARAYVVGNRIAGKRGGFDIRRARKPCRDIPFSRRPKHEPWCRELGKSDSFHRSIFHLRRRQ